MSTACGASYRHGRDHLALNFLGSHSANWSPTELFLVEISHWITASRAIVVGKPCKGCTQLWLVDPVPL